MATPKINIPMLGAFLGIIAAVAAGLLASVYSATKPQIEANKKAVITTAMALVLPEYDNQPSEETNTFVSAIGWPVMFYTARKNGKVVGYAGRVDNPDEGFSGTISLMVGLNPDGSVAEKGIDGSSKSAVIVTAQTETPGLGTAVTDRKAQKTIVELIQGGEEASGLVANKYLDWYAGKKAGHAPWSIVKEGEQVNAKTGATITSRAICRAVYAVSKTAQDHIEHLSKGIAQ